MYRYFPDDVVRAGDNRFDPAFVLLKSNLAPGQYHSDLIPGIEVHSLRDSAVYGVALLAAGGERQRDRGARILAKVISFQETDPSDPRFGYWPLFAEEPVQEWRAANPGLADFIGFQIAYAYYAHSAALTSGDHEDLVEQLRAAMTRAAWSIFRENTPSSYTNMAAAGAIVTCMVGELTGEATLVEYGRRRMVRLRDHRNAEGGFSEYNSPGYLMSTIRWCEAAIALLHDHQMRDAAEDLRRTIWTDYADHFHAATGQLAGPHSRAYHEWMYDKTADRIGERIDADIPKHARVRKYDDDPVSDIHFVVPPISCPDELIDRFTESSIDPSERRHAYTARGSKTWDASGTTWICGDRSIGSVSQDCTWIQRHPLIGYLRTQADPAVMVRVTMLHDGVEFASGFIWSDQMANRVLSAFGLLTDKGDFHHHLDTPYPRGVFSAADFRIRYEAIGAGVEADEIGETRFEFRCPPYRIVLHPAEGSVGEFPIEWRCGNDEQYGLPRAYLDGVWYDGPRREIDFTSMTKIRAACGLEMLELNEEPAHEAIVISAPRNDEVGYTWNIGPNTLVVTASRAPFARM